MALPKLLTLSEVLEWSGWTKPTLYNRIRLDGFPAGIDMGGARQRAWRESDIVEWLQSQEQGIQPSGGPQRANAA